MSAIEVTVMRMPEIERFFHNATNTFSYVVRDPDSQSCAIVDPVLDLDYACGRTGTGSADAILAFVRARELCVDWILETHVHADHLSAAHYLQTQLGGRIGIGSRITEVQAIFGRLFNAGRDFRHDGSQFDRLFADGERFNIGGLTGEVMHTPGHTPACVTYRIGDAAFVGDTLFMPDYGTARCDFPGGDARILYKSIQRILALPDGTRLFLCHDYGTSDRSAYCGETTVVQERRENIHIGDGIDEEAFVRMRTERDATLAMPNLLLPSVQVNMRAGRLPPAEDNGIHYLKIPLDCL